ncbi:MAG: non-heme iron oxygenase ferredoxin subunit [Deltaproteobacteria bacterium]|nr:non-heme iron oxygenase ferredoxin subunit [Deltaproteobacteria bacterium]
MGRYVRVCRVEEISPGTAKMVKVEGKPIAIFNLNGAFYATDDNCPHEGGPLSDGFIEGESVTCPWHGAAFHIVSGKTLEPPAGEKMGPPVDKGLICYPVRVLGGDLEVEI